MLFDSHCHVDDDKFNEDREDLLSTLPKQGIDYIMNIGADMESSRKAVVLAKKYPYIYASVGVHPSETTNLSEKDMDELALLATEPKVKAIGEIGLDYHYPDTNKEMQHKWFNRQMELAMDLGMPFIIHDRESHFDCMEILKRFDTKKTGGVMHCFSGSVEMAREVIKMGMHISFAGPITYKNAEKAVKVAMEIPIEHILIETDSPYLAPTPKRGERNNPAYVRFVAEKLAEIKNMPFEKVCEITKENAKNLFGIL